MREQLEQMQREALAELAVVNSEEQLQALKVRFLGARASLLPS